MECGLLEQLWVCTISLFFYVAKVKMARLKPPATVVGIALRPPFVQHQDVKMTAAAVVAVSLGPSPSLSWQGPEWG
jgi:hypothetical protein